MADKHEFLGARHWQCAKEDRIEERKDGRVRANPERQGQDRRRREARVASHLPPGVHKIMS